MAKTSKFLTAAEARKLADTSNRVVNVIARNIKEAAEDGQNMFMFTVSDFSSEQKNKVVSCFEELGYMVEVITNQLDESIGYSDVVVRTDTAIVFRW